MLIQFAVYVNSASSAGGPGIEQKVLWKLKCSLFFIGSGGEQIRKRSKQRGRCKSTGSEPPTENRQCK